MMISTRGRYALRVMVDLAAARQQVSLKYLERIMPMLVEQGLVEGTRGKGGGYRLTREPAEYPVGEILRATEASLAPVACLAEGAEPCERAPYCATLPLWKELDALVNGFLDAAAVEGA